MISINQSETRPTQMPLSYITISNTEAVPGPPNETSPPLSLPTKCILCVVGKSFRAPFPSNKAILGKQPRLAPLERRQQAPPDSGRCSHWASHRKTPQGQERRPCLSPPQNTGITEQDRPYSQQRRGEEAPKQAPHRNAPRPALIPDHYRVALFQTKRRCRTPVSNDLPRRPPSTCRQQAQKTALVCSSPGRHI